jgi:hypothetical protein
MSGISCLRRTQTTYVDRARGKVYRLYVADDAPCADTRTLLRALPPPSTNALELEPEETLATLPALGGPANTTCMEWTAAARHARQHSGAKCTPSSLVSTAATATSGSPTAGASPYAVDRRKRDEAGRGAARGDDAGVGRLAARGRGDQHRQGDKLANQAAGTQLACVFARGVVWVIG